MRKHYLLLFLAALLLPLGAKAQEELTVCDSTVTSYVFPVYSMWLDENTHTQTVYPAEMLDELAGNDIVSLKWYLSSAPSSAWGSVFTIRLMTVDDVSSESAFIDVSSATEVYQGTLTVAGNEIEIELDEAFTYEGGGLLVDFQSVASNYSSAYFYGASASTSVSRYARGSNQATTSFFMPKLTIGYELGNPDACRRVKELTVTEIDSNTATITWIDTANLAASYDIEVISGTDTQIVDTAISGTTYTITDLNANTAYTFGVRAVCAADNAASWATVAARTACAEMVPLPYVTSFTNDFDADTYVPLCWYQLRTAPYQTTSLSALQPLVWGNAGVGGSGDNALGFVHQNASDTGMICTAVLPGEALHISFWMNVISGTAVVGFISDTADLATFSPVLTVQPGGGYTEYDLYTADYPEAAGARLAFFSGGMSRVFVDNLSIKQASACRRPLSASVSAVGHNSATVVWDDPDGSAWTVSYSIVANDTADNSNNAVLVQATEPSATLTGLQPGTTYYAWVRTVCEGSTSDWRSCGSFTTELSCYDITNLQVSNTTSNSAVATWTYSGNGRGLDETGAIVTIFDITNGDSVDVDSTTWVVNGNYAFLTNLVEGHRYTVMVTTLCDGDTAEAMERSFSVASCGSTPLDEYSNYYYPINVFYSYSYSQTIYSGSYVSSMDTIYGVAIRHAGYNTATRNVDVYLSTTTESTLSAAQPVTNATLVASGNYTFGAADGAWDTITFTTPFVYNGGNLLITFDDNTGDYEDDYPEFYYHESNSPTFYYASDDDNMSPANPVPSDDWYYMESDNSQADMLFIGQCADNSDCPQPNVAVASAEDASVTLVWIAGGSESSWTVEYLSDTNATWTTAGTATDTSYTVTGLTPRTHYSFRVGYTCGDAVVYSPAVGVYTGCAPVDELPITENFENTPVGADPFCWQVYSSDDFGYHYVSTNGHGEGQGMNIYSYGATYFVSPALPAGTDPTQLEISWWATYGGNANCYEMGLMTDPTDPATFRRLFHTAGNSGTWTEYTAYADTVTLGPDETIYVAFRTGAANGVSVNIDDINIDITSCRRLTDVHIATLADTTATVAWTATEGIDTYEYCVTTTDTIPADIEPMTTTEAGCILVNLTPNTHYYVWVRPVCEEGTAQWSAECSFRTNCAVAQATPWAEDFSSWEEYGYNECWLRYNGVFDTVPSLTPTTSGWSASSSYGSIAIDGNALAMNLWSNYSYWAVSPALAINADMALSFDIAATGYYDLSTNFDDNDRIVVAISTNDGASWTPIYQMGSDTTRDDMNPNDLGSEYTNIMVGIGDYEGQTVRFAFVGSSLASGGDNRVVIDNIIVQSLGCAHPVNVSVSAIEAESAEFTWQDISTDNNDGYILLLGTVNNIDSATMNYTTGDTAYSVSGLTANTVYYWFLRSACEETPTSTSWVHGSFRTACENGNCTFSIVMSDSYGDGWNGNAVQVYSAGSLFASATIAGNSSSATETFSPCLGDSVVLVWQSGLYAYETSFSIVNAADSTVLNVNGGDQCTTGDTLVVFDGQCAATAVFVPDTCETPTDLVATATDTSISITFNSNAYDYDVAIVEGTEWDEDDLEVEYTEENEYTFTGLTPNTTYTVGVRAYCGETYGYGSWTYATVTTDGDTPGPVECNAPTSLTTVNIDSTMVTLNWTAGGTESLWQLMLNDDADNLRNVSAKPYVLSGLTPATNYSVKVRAICGDNNSSVWSAPLNFTTTAGGNQEGIDRAGDVSFSLYPNPASSSVTVATSASATVCLLDISGRTVYCDAEQAELHTIDVSSMAKGVYYVRVTDVNGTAVRKLVVK